MLHEETDVVFHTVTKCSGEFYWLCLTNFMHLWHLTWTYGFFLEAKLLVHWLSGSTRVVSRFLYKPCKIIAQVVSIRRHRVANLFGFVLLFWLYFRPVRSQTAPIKQKPSFIVILSAANPFCRTSGSVCRQHWQSDTVGAIGGPPQKNSGFNLCYTSRVTITRRCTATILALHRRNPVQLDLLSCHVQHTSVSKVLGAESLTLK